MRNDSYKSKIVDFLNEYPGRTNSEIAQGAGVPENDIRFYLFKLKKAGWIFGSNKEGWFTDEDLSKRKIRKQEIANNVLEECYAMFEICQDEKNKIQLAKIIADLLKRC